MPNDVIRAKKQGGLLYVYRFDGTTDVFTPSVTGFWNPNEQTTSDLAYVRDYTADQMWFCRYDGPTLFIKLAGSEFYMPPTPPVAPPPPTPPPTPYDTQALLVNWMLAHIGRYSYSQASPRLIPDVTGHTDCSGCVWYCYKMVTGSESAIPLISGNTYTGTQITQGTYITGGAKTWNESLMRLGDLVFFDWASNGITPTYDHVEMYIGNNQTCGHGGGMGPKVKSLSYNANFAARVMVRRYI